MSRISTAAIIFAIALMTAHTTHAAEISTDYLDGLWSLDGKEACGTDNYEYVALRADGVVETGDDGRPHGAGFWELKEGEMTFHLSTSPAFHRDDLKGVGGVYDNFDIRVITYNVEADQFGAIGLLGKEVARATFTRCP
jgi:hypothetical protein